MTDGDDEAVINFETAKVTWDNTQFYVQFLDIFGEQVGKEIVVPEEGLESLRRLFGHALWKYRHGYKGGREPEGEPT